MQGEQFLIHTDFTVHIGAVYIQENRFPFPALRCFQLLPVYALTLSEVAVSRAARSLRGSGLGDDKIMGQIDCYSLRPLKHKTHAFIAFIKFPVRI